MERVSETPVERPKEAELKTPYQPVNLGIDLLKSVNVKRASGSKHITPIASFYSHKQKQLTPN
jgi:hypothetical protein